LADRDEVLEHISTVLRAGPEHPFFAKALDYTTDHGYGRATQTAEVSLVVSVANTILAAQARSANR
jgi:hypothetical protein